jgi:membrane-associated protein
MTMHDWQAFLNQSLSYAGTFSLEMILILLVLCLIGEGIGLSVPYLLETIWLMAGYHLANGSLSVVQLLVLLLAAQVGRQCGLLALYYFSRTGSVLLARLAKRFKWNLDVGETITLRGGHKVNLLSPFSVALGRLFWMRIPLTLILGAKRKLRTLVLGVVMSSLIYDGTYITLGAVLGTTTRLEPLQMTLLLLATLIFIYAVTFVVKRIIGLFTARKSRMPEVP